MVTLLGRAVCISFNVFSFSPEVANRFDITNLCHIYCLRDYTSVEVTTHNMQFDYIAHLSTERCYMQIVTMHVYSLDSLPFSDIESFIEHKYCL